MSPVPAGTWGANNFSEETHAVMDATSLEQTGSVYFLQDVPRSTILPDETVFMLREGYDFISNRCRKLNSDAFRTRIMGRSVICMRGPAAANFIYGNENLTRVGGMPQTVLRLLQDRESVQQLDGDAHRARKEMFVRLLIRDENATARLVDLFRREWLRRLPLWQQEKRVTLLQEVSDLLAKVSLSWCGVPERYGLADERRILAQMIEAAGHFGPRTFLTLFRRSGFERSLQSLIEETRSRPEARNDRSPLCQIAMHRDHAGRLITVEAAAVEVINLLRPITAIGRYIVFAALRLHLHPQWPWLFRNGGDELIDDFVEEVRRISPFFPFVGAVAKNGFRLHEITFEPKQWFLLDLYGTMNCEDLFPQPDKFKPYRQLSSTVGGGRFIPQGAGDVVQGHRCPGEKVTVAIMAEAVRLLTRAMTYTVPKQDLRIRHRRIPAAPASGFIITGVVPVPYEATT